MLLCIWLIWFDVVYVVSGTVEKIGRMLAISFRQYNVKTEALEASIVKNYIYQPLEMTTLLRFAVQGLFGDTTVTEIEKLYLFETIFEI